MAKRSGLTRGDRRRNDRIEALRTVVRPDRAILSIDLGEDKQAAALLDHDGRVLGRRMVIAKAHALGGLLSWAAGQAVKRGFAGVVVGCEPTGHRWRSLLGLADEAGWDSSACTRCGCTWRGRPTTTPATKPIIETRC